MKIWMLVISSDTFPVYARHRAVWKTYMKSHPNIDCVFLESRPGVFVPTLSSDTLTLRGVERYGTILRKTIEALEYFLSRRTYDYVVRTNLSSVWDFKELLRYLETQPRERVYAGQVGVNPDTGLEFASGAGILMSPDVARTLVANQQIARTLSAFDDVAIAKALGAAGLRPTPLPRIDFMSLAHYDAHHDKIPDGAFHYRIKHSDLTGDLMEEPIIMSRLLREHIYAS
jgi:hypothetical protein